ncbi:MAG: diaminopimelate decarboxylase [Gemmatimonadaceae bacterium]|nr:diaminopimelate decarboxylase [Gemmatimonadaceae bacterium]
MGTSVLTPASVRRAGTLHMSDVPLTAVADAVGTPTYCYSADVIRDRYARLTAALEGVPYRVHYSVKANGCSAILRLLASLGSGVDVVSGGEMFKAQRAGLTPATDIIFGGVGKTASELREGIAAGVKLLNAESMAEVELIGAIAAELGVRANVGLRVNPEIPVANWHHYIKTGEKGHKFGIPYGEVAAVAQRALELPSVRLAALDMHVGSQLTSVDAYEHGAARLVALVAELRALGASELAYLDVGGGLSVRYDDEVPMEPEDFGRIVTRAAHESGLELIVEPGRYLVGNAGLLLARVIYRKQSGGKSIVITDAGMNDLVRPALYKAFHRIEAVEPLDARLTADIVGPVCETGDFFALDRDIEDAQPGALLALHDAGAYGYVMASNYNARGRPAEVMVDGARFAVVTARETYDDLVRRETASPTWHHA